MRDSDLINDLLLMRHQLQATRRNMLTLLDAWEERINRLLPKEDSKRQAEMRRYTRKDWSRFLDRKTGR